MNFDGYVAAPTGSNDGSIDDYHCLSEGDAKNKCIYKDIAMIINGDVNKRVLSVIPHLILLFSVLDGDRQF